MLSLCLRIAPSRRVQQWRYSSTHTEQVAATADSPRTLLDAVSHLRLGLLITIHAFIISPHACYMHTTIPVYPEQLIPKS
jgi:hypothetical protein